MTEDELWSKYFADRSDVNRNALVEFYMPDVERIAQNVLNRGPSKGKIPVEELASAGWVALIKAVPKFKTGRSTFRNFMYRQLQCAMLKERERITDPQYQGIGTYNGDYDEAAGDTDDISDIANDRNLLSVIQSHCHKLTSRQREFMRLHFTEGLNLSECGGKMGIGRNRAWQYRNLIVAKLKGFTA